MLKQPLQGCVADTEPRHCMRSLHGRRSPSFAARGFTAHIAVNQHEEPTSLNIFQQNSKWFRCDFGMVLGWIRDEFGMGFGLAWGWFCDYFDMVLKLMWNKFGMDFGIGFLMVL